MSDAPKHLSLKDAINTTPIGEYTYFSASQPEISKKKTESFSVAIFKIGFDRETRERIALETVMRITGKTERPGVVYTKADYAVKRLNFENPRKDDLENLVARIQRELEHV